MPKKITYLLGAGASANVLPTIKGVKDKNIPGLSESMRQLASILSKNEDNAYQYSENFKSTIQGIVKDLKHFAEKSDEFETIDTYAKYCYITNQTSQLNKLKKTLSIYFCIKQLVNKFDKRCLIFLTSIIGRDQKFPENVNVLTWNYDFQMQMAAQEFVSSSSSNSILHYYPNDGSYINTESRRYNLVHLNGLAGFYSPRGKLDITRYFKKGI